MIIQSTQFTNVTLLRSDRNDLVKNQVRLPLLVNHLTDVNVLHGIGTFRFFFEGKRLQPTETPLDHEMIDGDSIDANLQQVRAPSSRKKD